MPSSSPPARQRLKAEPFINQERLEATAIDTTPSQRDLKRVVEAQSFRVPTEPSAQSQGTSE